MTDINQTKPADSAETRALLPLLAVSLSIGVAGRVADNLWLTWEQICAAFREQVNRLSDTKDGLLVSFAHFDRDYKITSQVTDLFAVCLDFDHQTTVALNNAIALAQRLSTRGIVHTTWSDEPWTSETDLQQWVIVASVSSSPWTSRYRSCSGQRRGRPSPQLSKR